MSLRFLLKWLEKFDSLGLKGMVGLKEKLSSAYLKSDSYILLFLILVVGLLIRFWILNDRWINPDEGAHIMDGRLVLDGLVPKVDYDARQPLYVYLIAIILKVFGISYLNVRLFLPLVCSSGVTLLVFLISRRLFNDKIAILSSVVYTFLPLSIVESTIVKTEPLTTLLSSIAIYLVIAAVWDGKRPRLLLFLSGISLSLAYYARESSLSVLLGVFLFFVVAYWRDFRRVFRNYVVILAGYLSVCLLAFTYYGQYMSFNQLLESSINPLNIVFESAKWVFESTNASATIPEAGGYDFSGQPWSETFRYLHLTLFSNSFLFAGLILSIYIFIRSLSADGTEGKSIFLKFSLLYSWISSLALAYAFWTLHHGYFIQYFEEFLPPLSILLAFVIICSLSLLNLQKTNNRMNLTIIVTIFGLLLVTLFFFSRGLPDFQVKSPFYVLLAISFLSFVYFSQEPRLGKWLYMLLAMGIVSAVLIILISLSPLAIRVPSYLILFALIYFGIFRVAGIKAKRDFRKGLGFIFLSFIIFSFLLSVSVSGRKMGLDFDCLWSPETVREVSHYIRTNSLENDEIISGGVIWELQAGRRPFMNQSHPQVYSFGISSETRENIEWHLTAYPPKLIVLDGYTEITYLNQVDKLRWIMDEKYKLKRVVEGSRYPIKIYELDQSVSGY